MKEFNGHRLHFDISSRGLLRAVSDPVTMDQCEEYQGFFECGIPWTNRMDNNLYWQADSITKEENSIRLAERFLKEYGDEFPAKAKNVKWMLERRDEDY